MSRLPDGALRLIAWAAPVFLAGTMSIGLALSLSDRTPTSQHASVAFALFSLTFPCTGLLILRRQPRNTIGWLLQLIGLVWGVSSLADSYVRYALLLHPGSVPGARVVAALNEGSWVPGIGLMGTFLLLLFPDGRLPSPRWRPVAWASAMTMLLLTAVVALEPGPLDNAPVAGLDNPLAFDSSSTLVPALFVVLLAVLPVCIMASATSVLGRFRRATGVERLQLRWFVSAGVMIALLFLLSFTASVLAWATGAFSGAPGRAARWMDALETLTVWSFVLLPVSIGIAVLRYRLYAIDRVINRALVYGLLTAALACVYLVSVLVLQTLLSPLTDRSDLAVAASTLAVAALFRPVRTRVQGAVDRRFFRRRYDAARTLDDFVSRLRHEVDLDSVGDDLRATVRSTVQPASVSLWLRGTP